MKKGPAAACTPGDGGNPGKRAIRSKIPDPKKAPRQAHLVTVAKRGTRAIERWAVENTSKGNQEAQIARLDMFYATSLYQENRI